MLSMELLKGMGPLDEWLDRHKLALGTYRKDKHTCSARLFRRQGGGSWTGTGPNHRAAFVAAVRAYEEEMLVNVQRRQAVRTCPPVQP